MHKLEDSRNLYVILVFVGFDGFRVFNNTRFWFQPFCRSVLFSIWNLVFFSIAVSFLESFSGVGFTFQECWLWEFFLVDKAMCVKKIIPTSK